ncbi:hypothetical protein Tco_0859208 [Tanacetum coccineum]|uniref:Uncharacterized protein n=1 Tax=Tanacetum coccineum TaxID=301880 RepID=A0ABQ5BF09_9ASTR
MENEGFMEVRHKRQDNWKSNRNPVHNNKKGESVNAERHGKQKNGIYVRKQNVNQNQNEQIGNKAENNKGQENGREETRKWEEDRRKEKEDLRDDIEDVMESENLCARMCSGGLVGNTCPRRDVIIYITQNTKNDL